MFYLQWLVLLWKPTRAIYFVVKYICRLQGRLTTYKVSNWKLRFWVLELSSLTFGAHLKSYILKQNCLCLSMCDLLVNNRCYRDRREYFNRRRSCIWDQKLLVQTLLDIQAAVGIQYYYKVTGLKTINYSDEYLISNTVFLTVVQSWPKESQATNISAIRMKEIRR